MSWTPGETLPFLSTNVYEYIHKNGLRVLLCPVADANVCGYMRAVHAGSKEEAGCVPMGAAHFIEHMSFRIQKGRIWTLASKGDVINAETNMDSTRFYVVHLPEQTEQTIQIDAERFKEAAVPAEKVPVERQAVLNELENGKRAGNRGFSTTSSVAMLEHPYHHSPIGTFDAVTNTKASDMEHFRKKYYVCNNTTLIIVGSFDAARVLDMVHAHFGDLVPGQDCHTQHTTEPVQEGKRTVELEIEAPCPMTFMAFHQPRGMTKESLTLQCISRLTWMNQQGRAKQLIENGHLHDVSSYSPRQLDPYLWFFHGTSTKTSPEIRMRLESEMMRVLQSFVHRKVTPKELDNIKISMRDDWQRSLESVTDMMNELGRCVSTGDWKDFAIRDATLDQITPQDIQRVAEATFKRSNMTVTHIIPSKTVHAYTPETKMCSLPSIQSPMAADIEAPSSGADSWSVHSVSPTTNVLHIPRASYVRVTLSARFSPAEHDIATIMTSSMGKDNTSSLMSMHSERSFTHDHEFVHMAMGMPTQPTTLKKASHLMFHDEWMTPNFTSHVVELQKQHHIAEMQSLHNDQEFQTKRHFLQHLFEKTIYHIPLEARIQRMTQLTAADIRAFHKKWISTNQSTYVTVVSPDTKTADTLRQILPAHVSEPSTTLAWKANPRQAANTRVVLGGYGSVQIMIGQTVAVEHNSSEFVALQCAINVLGKGMGGRLMKTVRVERGLGTYGLYACLQTISPRTPAVFCVEGTFNAPALDEGMALTKKLIQEWYSHGITASELDVGKSSMIGSKTIASDTVQSLYSMVLKDILEKRNPKEAFAQYKDMVDALTLDDVNRAIRKFVDTSALATVVVGPK